MLGWSSSTGYGPQNGVGCRIVILGHRAEHNPKAQRGQARKATPFTAPRSAWDDPERSGYVRDPHYTLKAPTGRDSDLHSAHRSRRDLKAGSDMEIAARSRRIIPGLGLWCGHPWSSSFILASCFPPKQCNCPNLKAARQPVGPSKGL